MEIPSQLLNATPINSYISFMSLSVSELTKLGLNRNLAKHINKLDKKQYSSYLQIINDKGLMIMVNDVLNTDNNLQSIELIRLYQTIVSNTFNILVENLFPLVDNFGASMRSCISYRLTHIEEPIPLSIYRGIYDTVIYGAQLAKTVPNLVIETPKNVQVSKDIEALNLTSYKSLLQYFTNFRHFYKESASESIIFSATFVPNVTLDQVKLRDTLKPRLVFFKIFPTDPLVKLDGTITSYNTIGLETEASIYEQLGKLVEYGVTPNILSSIWSGKINKFDTNFISSPILPLEFQNNCGRDVYNINVTNQARDPNYVWKETGVVMTLAGDSVLDDIIHTLTINERKEVMFQIIYTLYVFEQLEISHGDLHAGNIFVQNVSPTTLNFQINNVHYSVTTTKLIKIYDFDRSTICKKTDIVLDINDSFTINVMLNPNRANGMQINTHFAETNIFNKNLDLMILFSYGLTMSQNLDETLNFIYFKNVDPVFNEFVKYAMGGFYRGYPVSNETIRQTYTILLEDVANRLEASRIFNVDIQLPINLNVLGISEDVLNMTWWQYYIQVNGYFGRIVKTFNSRVDNNHLWIPDEIIIPKLNMLQSPYFSEYMIDEPIDVTRGIVYSIDNRIIA
jgi:hypothetical protein